MKNAMRELVRRCIKFFDPGPSEAWVKYARSQRIKDLQERYDSKLRSWMLRPRNGGSMPKKLRKELEAIRREIEEL